MSNGILPAQTTRPTLREWMLTRLFSNRAVSLEFYDRLMNLCNYDYPMTPALRAEVTRTFGEELLGTIEQYRDREVRVLSSGLLGAFRRVIPNEYYLEFVRLFECTCCPPIIQTVADIADAVDGTVIGQLTISRYADSAKYHLHLYEWDGADWILIIDTTTGGSLTEFDSFEVESITSPWQITVDQGAVWTDASVTFDPAVTSIEVWFRNTESGCIYTNVPIIPTGGYCAPSSGIFPDFASLPAGSSGDIAMVSEFDGLFDHRGIYQYDGADWIQMVEVTAVPPSPYDGANVSVFYIDPAWYVSFDGGATWVQDSTTIVSTSTLTVGYKNPNDCIYNNNNIT